MAKRTLTIGIEEGMVRELDRLADHYSTTRSLMLKKILGEGLRRAALEYAAGLYGRKEATLERAAEVAGVSLYEMIAYLRQRGVPCQRSVMDIREDARAALVRAGRENLAEALRNSREQA